MTLKFNSLTGFLLCLFLFGQSTAAFGQSNYWTAAGENTLWETPSNWSNASPPASQDDVFLTEDSISEDRLFQNYWESEVFEEEEPSKGPIQLIEVKYDNPSIDQTTQYNFIDIDAPMTQGIYLNHSSGILNAQNMSVAPNSSGSYLISGDAELNITDTLSIGTNNMDYWMGYEGLVKQNGGTLNANNVVLAGSYDTVSSKGNGRLEIDAGEANLNGLVIGLDGRGEVTQRGGTVNNHQIILGGSIGRLSSSDVSFAVGYGTYNLEGGDLNSSQISTFSQATFNQTGGRNSVGLDMVIGGGNGTRCDAFPALCDVDPSTQVWGKYKLSDGDLEIGYGNYISDNPSLVLGDGSVSPYNGNISGGYGIFEQSGGNAKFKRDVVIGDIDNTPPLNPYATDYTPSDNPNGYGEGLYRMSGGTMSTEGDLYVGENVKRNGGIGVYYSKGVVEQTGGTVNVDGSLHIASSGLQTHLSSNLPGNGRNKYAITGPNSRLTVGNSIHVGSDDLTLSERWGKLAELEISNGAVVDSDIIVHKGGLVTGSFGWRRDFSLFGGVLAPGNSPGTITIEGDLYATNNSLFEIEVFSFNPGGFDIIDVFGDAYLEEATFRFDFTEFELGDFSLDDFIGESFDFIKIAGEVILGDIAYEVIGKEWILDIDLASGSARIAGVEGGVGSPIPEPTTMLLFGLGLLGVAGVSRRKTKQPTGLKPVGLNSRTESPAIPA